MARLCRESPIPIALDEELIGVNHPHEKERLLRELRPQYLVLKPTLHGGMAGTEEWMRLSARHGIPYWVTSALESNVGLNAVAQLTAYAAEKHGAKTPQKMPPIFPATHGLGTGQLYLKNYTATRLVIKSGVLPRPHPSAERLCPRGRGVQARMAQPRALPDRPHLRLHRHPAPLRVLKTHMSASAQKRAASSACNPATPPFLPPPAIHRRENDGRASLVSHLRLSSP